MRGIRGQHAVVCVHGFGARGGIGFVLQCDCEPVLRAAFRHHANFIVQFARIEIQHELAADGFEAGAVVFDDYVAAVGEDAQLGERRLHLRELFVERDKGAAEAICRDTFFDELLGGAQGDEVAKIVKFFGAAFARRNQLQTLPVVELLVGDVQEALELTPAKSFGSSHVIAASISSAKSLISTALLVANFVARLTPQKRQQAATLQTLQTIPRSAFALGLALPLASLWEPLGLAASWLTVAIFRLCSFLGLPSGRLPGLAWCAALPLLPGRLASRRSWLACFPDIGPCIFPARTWRPGSR